MRFPDEIMRHINEYNNIHNYFPSILHTIFYKFSIPKLVAILERHTILRFKKINRFELRKLILKIFFDTRPTKQTLQNIVASATTNTSMYISRSFNFYDFSHFINFDKRIPVKNVIIKGCSNLFTCAEHVMNEIHIIYEILKYGEYRQLLFYKIMPYTGVHTKFDNRFREQLIIPNPETRQYVLTNQLTIFL